MRTDLTDRIDDVEGGRGGNGEVGRERGLLDEGGAAEKTAERGGLDLRRD